MKYSFTFDTVPAYQAAKSSSGSGGDIYNVLKTTNTSTQTNTDGALSRTAISTIKSTGQTFVDAFNVIVPREQGGEIGDTLLYKDNTYYWLKGRMEYSSTSLGGIYATYQSSNILGIPGYTVIGFVGHREGTKCLIFCDVDKSGYPVANNRQQTSFMAAIGNVASDISKNGVAKKEGHSEALVWNANASLEYSEAILTGPTREFPITREAWNAMVSNIMSNTSTVGRVTTGVSIGMSSSETIVDGGYEVTEGESIGIANLRYMKETSSSGNVSAVQIDPADYDYDYDKFFRSKCLLKYPVRQGALSDKSGKTNTKLLLSENSSNENKYPAAKICDEYTPSGAPSLFGAGKWWLPCATEAWYILRNAVSLLKKGFFKGNATIAVCSSTPYVASDQKGTFVAYLGTANVRYVSQTQACYAYPVTEFII